MMMLLLGGRETVAYADSLRDNLAGLTAQLLQAGKVTGCMAALPADKDGRRWVLSFLASLKRAGGQRTCLLLRASTLSTADFADGERAGLDEAVILQDLDDPEAAVELLLGYLYARPATKMRFRVWLDQSAGQQLQRSARAWQQAAPWMLGVELSPFSWESQSNGSGSPSNGSSRSHKNGGQPLRCAWFENALTMDCKGSVVPCSQHDAREGLPLNGSSAAQVQAQLEDWSGRLGAHPVCGSCHSLARFSVPAWMRSEAVPGPPPEMARFRFEDYIRCNVESLPEDERESLLADFLKRASAILDAADGGGPA